MTTTNRGNSPLSPEMQQPGDDILHKASSGAHHAVDSMASTADVAASKVKPAIDAVAARAHQTVNKATDAAAPTADWLTEHGEKLVADTSSYVSEHPMKAAGFALLAGFLLSRIILR